MFALMYRYSLWSMLLCCVSRVQSNLTPSEEEARQARASTRHQPSIAITATPPFGSDRLGEPPAFPVRTGPVDRGDCKDQERSRGSLPFVLSSCLLSQPHICLSRPIPILSKMSKPQVLICGVSSVDLWPCGSRCLALTRSQPDQGCCLVQGGAEVEAWRCR